MQQTVTTLHADRHPSWDHFMFQLPRATPRSLPPIEPESAANRNAFGQGVREGGTLVLVEDAALWAAQE
jgi:hypothetical protein